MGSLVDDAAGFLAGPGHALARRALASHGLPAHLVDDVVQDALVRALRAEQRGDDVRNIEAFTTVLVQRSVRDLLRGIRRRPEGHVVEPPPTGDGIEPFAPVLADDRPEAEVVAAAQASALRRQLGRMLDGAARPAAGALAVLAVAVDGAEPADDCPAPVAGAGPDEALAWAGLFYAGRVECFPTAGGVDDAATRQRRSRAVRDQRRVLLEAMVEVDPDVGVR